MAEIKRLPINISNLIAAGEVVERPASVIKELVENAIDAGASKIVVEMRNGGVSYMRITDDGRGIEPGQVRVAFERHATSKIQTEADLFDIRSLGFRGEALAAIAAVSKIDIFTKIPVLSVGTHLTLEGGQEVLFEEAGCPDGTTIVVQDLFFNTPARMKFMKNDRTEGSHIESIVERLAVSRPDISVKLIKDGREVFTTQGDQKLTNAIYSVFGAEVSQGLINAGSKNFNNTGIGVCGVISPPSATRANKNMQVFFVNGRHIKSRLIGAAVERSYQGRIPIGRMPICFLMLTMPALNVDVNAHPAKLEVKFSNEKQVFDAVYGFITDVLSNMGLEELESPVDFNDTATYPREVFTNKQVQVLDIPLATSDSKSERQVDLFTFETADSIPQAASDFTKGELIYTPYSGATVAEAPVHLSTKEEPQKSLRDEIMAELSPCLCQENSGSEGVRIIGEIFKTYIIIEHNNTLKLIDKHAVHERIVYNKLSSTDIDAVSQALLTPEHISLTREEKAVVLNGLDLFLDLGFEIEDIGTNIISVRSAPEYVPAHEVSYIITEVIEKLIHHNFSHGDLIEDTLKSISCKAAVKAGFINHIEELEPLVKAVLSQPNLQSCPHGRPTIFTLTKQEIEKAFKRI